MRKVYYTALHNMIVFLNIRFDHESIIALIKSGSMLFDLNIKNDNINLLNHAFNGDSNVLKTKINLLKHTADIANDIIYFKTIEKWIKWLYKLCYGRRTIFFNFS